MRPLNIRDFISDPQRHVLFSIKPKIKIRDLEQSACKIFQVKDYNDMSAYISIYLKLIFQIFL